MRIHNKKLLDSTDVALTQASEAQQTDHIFMYDVTVTLAANNPTNKELGAVTAGTDTVTLTGHGYLTGMKCQLTTTDNLPAGLAVSTDYYIIAVDADNIQFATSQANASAGTQIDITDAGTGTHTVAVTTALAGSVKLQKNNEPEGATAVWVDVPSSSQNFSAAGNLTFSDADVAYREMRAYITTTSGTVTADVRFNGKGL